MDDLSGKIIKDYELFDYIGAGRFGAVYRAYQSSVGRDVAIKIIAPEFANQPAFIRHFETEAQVIARLEHPHIVPLYNYWRSPEGAYLVMRWLPGNLTNSLQDGPLDVKTTALLLDQLTAALSVAHRQQVIHRAFKPANILMDEDGNAYVADFEIVGSSDLSNEHRPLEGLSDYLAPEQVRRETITPQTDIYSLGIILFELLTAQSPFSGNSVEDRLAKQLNVPLPPVNNLPNDIVHGVNAVIQRATAKNPAQRYPDVLSMAVAFREAIKLNRNESPDSVLEILTRREQQVLQRIIAGRSNKEIAQEFSVTVPTVKWHIRQIYGKLHVRRRVQAIVRARQLHLITPEITFPTTAIGSTQASDPSNPYKGLHAFKASDAHDFFGRESLIDKLIARLGETGVQSRFLAVIGPSGSGKSSLVMAGLIPALWRGALPESDRWFVVDMVPGTNPLDELEVALTQVAVSQLSNMRELLQGDDMGLDRVAQLILPNDGSQLILIIDQFEEVFTLVEDETARVHFMNLLYNAVNAPRSRVKLVITLRADFYDRPLQYPSFGELLQRCMETVLPLSADELERAIARPAEQVGITFEPGLVASIISEMNNQRGALPLLQYALTELFEHRQGNTLTREAYQAIGGTAAALARRADDIYNELDAESQTVARQMFLRLVTLGEGIEDTGRRVPRSELEAIAADEETIDDLIDLYADYRLISLDHDPITRGPTVELAHEAILREWKPLRDWLNESREDIRIHRRLRTAASEWIARQHHPGFLAMDAQLAQFEGLADKKTLALNSEELDYLQASIANRAAQQSLENQRQAHTANIARRAQNFGRAATILAVIGTMAVIATMIAIAQSSYAQNQMSSANATLTPIPLTSTAISQKMESINLGSQAVAELQNSDGNDEFAALLAIRSLKLGYYSVADEALLEVENKLPLKAFLGHTDEVRSVALSPDGRYLLSGSADHTAKLWDVITGKVVRTFVGHTDEIWSTAFSPDGNNILTGSADHTAKLWDTATGRLLHTFIGHSDEIRSVAFSRDGKYIATGSFDSTTKLWEIATGRVIQTIPIGPYSIAFSSDGQYILTNNLGTTATLWNVVTGQPIRTFSGHKGSVYSVAFSPDGKSILTGSLDNTAKLWDITTGQVLRTFVGHSGSVRSVTFSPDGQYVLTGSKDGTAKLWDVATGQVVRTLRGHADTVNSAMFSPDGKFIVTGSADHTIKLWDVATDLDANTLRGHTDEVYGVAFSPDGKYILTASADHTARLWDAISGHEIRTFAGHTDAVISVAFSPDGKYALTSSFDKTAKLWDVVTGQEVRTFTGHTGLVLGVAFSPDGKYVLTGSGDQTAKLWNLATGQEVRTFTGHTFQVWSVAFSPDAKYVLTGSVDNTAKLWDVATGQNLRTFSGHTGEVYSVAFSPDGKYIVTGSRDSTAKMWDVATGKTIFTLTGHTGTVDDAVFSPDGKYIVTGSADRTARLWSATTGELLRTLHGHDDAVWGVAFSPDGKHVLTGSLDHTAKLWETNYLDFVTTVCGRLLRDFTDEEREKASISDKISTCS